MKEVSWIKRLLFEKPLLKFSLLMVLNIILIFIVENFTEIPAVRIPIMIVHALLAVYFVLVIINVVRFSIYRLISSDDSRELIAFYIVFLIGIIIILSTVLNLIDLTRTGYITYGQCSEQFTKQGMIDDQMKSHSFFYYTAMLFTVGNGEICPMGLAKEFSMVTAIIGHVISVVLVAFIINNHFKLKEKKRKR